MWHANQNYLCGIILSLTGHCPVESNYSHIKKKSLFEKIQHRHTHTQSHTHTHIWTLNTIDIHYVANFPWSALKGETKPERIAQYAMNMKRICLESLPRGRIQERRETKNLRFLSVEKKHSGKIQWTCVISSVPEIRRTILSTRSFQLTKYIRKKKQQHLSLSFSRRTVLSSLIFSELLPNDQIWYVKALLVSSAEEYIVCIYRFLPLIVGR